jgi:uncharacterized membrane protein
MQVMVLVHILAGSLGMISGFIALYAAKGAPLHRRVGMVFVAVMLTMTTTGTVIAAVRGAAPHLNIPAALITSYLVITGLTTVRPGGEGTRLVNRAATAVGFGVGLFVLVLGVAAVTRGGKLGGMPAFPFFLFAALGLCGGVGDLRGMRAGSRRGAPRLTRHLWRMSMALFIAVMSFFLGQADVIPKPIRVVPLLMAPPLTVLATMLYWAWRVRGRRSLRGITRGRAQEATS